MIQYGQVMVSTQGDIAPIHWYSDKTTDERESNFGWKTIGWFVRDDTDPANIYFEHIEGVRVA